MTRLRTVVIGAVAGTLLLAAPLDAQRPPQGRRGGMQSREQLEQRVRARMGEIMQRRLGLTEEEGERLGEIVRSFDEQRRELFRAEQAVRRRVEALSLEPPAGDEEASELLERMVELRRQEAELFATEQAALREMLSPMQVLQLHVLREEIGRRIRALARGGDGARRRTRGGPPRGDGRWLEPGLRR